MQKYLIASGDRKDKIIILNIVNGDILKTIEEHSSIIYNLSKLSNNKLISCSNEETIKV